MGGDSGDDSDWLGVNSVPSLGWAWSQESQGSERSPQRPTLLVPDCLKFFIPTNPASIGPYSPRGIICSGNLVISAWLRDGNSTHWLKKIDNTLLLRFPCSFGHCIKMLEINKLLITPFGRGQMLSRYLCWIRVPRVLQKKCLDGELGRGRQEQMLSWVTLSGALLQAQRNSPK